MHYPKYHEQIDFEASPPHQGFKKSSCEDPKSCIASPFGTSSTKQSSDGMTHQRRTSLLTKDEQSTSSIGSTLTWSLISSGACIRASLKILRLPLFSPQVSPADPGNREVAWANRRRIFRLPRRADQ